MASEAIDLDGWTREEFDAHCRKLVQEALDDPRPPMPIEDAFAEIRRRAAVRRG